MPSKPQERIPSTAFYWAAIALTSILWWIFASQNSINRGILLVGLSLASFMVGCLVGFLFTSYGEEVGTIGKVRDWLIGGITALTIAKATAIEGVVKQFAVGSAPGEFPLMLSVAVFYAVLGFFFMFFQRELILNVLLAEKRSERSRLEGSRETGQVIQRFLLTLPPSLLSGVDDIEEISSVRKDEAKVLGQLLNSVEVGTFLQGADEALKKGTLDWDIVSKTSYIYYYRTYFEKENRDREVQNACAWITRALNMNPGHVDLTMKYADMLGAAGQYRSAVVILERLALRPEAPVLIRQWLGYFLLFVPGRENDAIECSEGYLKLFPDENDARFNIACAYAQMYCQELKSKSELSNDDSTQRRQALLYLRQALDRAPDYAPTVWNKWTKSGESFDCFISDSEFKKIVGVGQAPSQPSGSEPLRSNP